MSYSEGKGRATRGVRDACYVPPGGEGRRPLVVFCHGAGRFDARQAAGRMFSSYRTLLTAVAEAGFVVAAPTLTNLWGNATSTARIADAVRWARRHLGAGTDPPALIGASMGAVCALNYAASHPAAAVVGLIPVVDLGRARAADVNGVRGAIDAAWGVRYPHGLPLAADPATSTNRLDTTRQQLWWASDDPASAGIDDYATAVSADLRSVGALGHTDAAMAAAAPEAVLNFLKV